MISEDSSEGDLWSEICEQCASSHNVGHALLVVLICQYLVGSVGLIEDEQVCECACVCAHMFVPMCA